MLTSTCDNAMLHCRRGCDTWLAKVVQKLRACLASTSDCNGQAYAEADSCSTRASNMKSYNEAKVDRKHILKHASKSHYNLQRERHTDPRQLMSWTIITTFKRYAIYIHSIEPVRFVLYLNACIPITCLGDCCKRNSHAAHQPSVSS